MQTPDQLITIDEAARILTLRPATIRAMVNDGRLLAIHPAGARRVRFRLSDTERLAGLRAEREGSHGVAAEQPA